MPSGSVIWVWHMRKIALISIIAFTISMGFSYAINQQWLGVLACTLAGVIWVLPSEFLANQRSTFSLTMFTIIGLLGIFFSHPPIWTLTNFVFLLIVWDLDHYARVFQDFEKQPVNQNKSTELFYAHLKRLGLIAVAGWSLGMIALNIQINISFTVALILILLAIFALRGVARYIVSLPK